METIRKGDYVTWRISANSKVDLFGFVVEQRKDMLRMVVCDNADRAWERKSAERINIDMRARNIEAVFKAEIPRNIMSWSVDLVMLWFCASYHVLEAGYWNLQELHDVLRRSTKAEGPADIWAKEALILSVRRRQRRQALEKARYKIVGWKPRLSRRYRDGLRRY